MMTYRGRNRLTLSFAYEITTFLFSVQPPPEPLRSRAPARNPPAPHSPTRPLARTNRIPPAGTGLPQPRWVRANPTARLPLRAPVSPVGARLGPRPGLLAGTVSAGGGRRLSTTSSRSLTAGPPVTARD